jgi:hypothetical protein
LSFRIVNKIQKITFNRAFFIKNIATIGIICIGIWLLKNNFFVLQDIHRYKNIVYFIIILIIYYLIIAGINYPSLKLLKKEIRTIRS